jgi:hypothetical protein
MEGALLPVTAVGEIGAGDPAEYGLDNPVCMIEAVASDGSVFACEVGNINDTANIVYVRTGGRIYMLDMSFSKIFCHTLTEMARREELLDIEASEADAIEIENCNGTLKLLHDPDGIPGSFKKLTGAFEGGAPADAETAKKLVSETAGLRADECVCYQPDAAALASYGLTEPAAVIRIIVCRRETGSADWHEKRRRVVLRLAAGIRAGMHVRGGGSRAPHQYP